MSSRLRSGESQRKKQVKFRAPEELVEEFDEWCDERDKSRAEALRAHVRACIEGTREYDTPRQPPTDDERLATAYRRLCGVANSDGIIREETAVSVLASVLGVSKTETKAMALRPLDKRGYLNRSANVYGASSYRIVGWDV